MATTYAEALAAIRENLDDEGATPVWPDATLIRWINEACQDITRRIECNRATETISAVAGQQEYSSPIDTVRIYRVEYQAQDDPNIHPLEYHQFNSADAVWWTQQAVTQSTPHLWTFWGRTPSLKLIVYPKPSLDGDLRVFYYALAKKRALDGSENDKTLDIPEGWEDLVYLFVEYRALRKDRDPRWQEARALYEELLGEMYGLHQTLSDQPETIVPEHTRGPYPAWLVNG